MSEINLSFAGGANSPFTNLPTTFGSAAAVGGGGFPFGAVGAGLAIFSTLESLRLGGIQADLQKELADISIGLSQANLNAIQGNKEYGAVPSEEKGRWGSPKGKLAVTYDWGVGLAELSRRKISRQKEAFLEKVEADEEKLGYAKEGFEIQRQRQKTQLALEQGNLGLARAEANKTARLESEQFRKLGASAGFSSFTRARGQLSINRVSPVEQRMTALQREGLLQEKEAGFIRAQFASAEERLGSAKERGLEQFADAFEELRVNTELAIRGELGKIAGAQAQKDAANESDKILGIIPNPF